MNIILVWLSGFLFSAGAWQLEIFNLRREHNEDYYLPFYLIKSKEWTSNYSFWGDVWMAVIIMSYILLLLATTVL